MVQAEDAAARAEFARKAWPGGRERMRGIRWKGGNEGGRGGRGREGEKEGRGGV